MTCELQKTYASGGLENRYKTAIARTAMNPPCEDKVGLTQSSRSRVTVFRLRQVKSPVTPLQSTQSSHDVVVTVTE